MSDSKKRSAKDKMADEGSTRKRKREGKQKKVCSDISETVTPIPEIVLPFAKTEMEWKDIESSEAFKRKPQYPHYGLLYSNVEELFREDVALTIMGMYLEFSEELINIGEDLPISRLNVLKENFYFLEKQGFDVHSYICMTENLLTHRHIERIEEDIEKAESVLKQPHIARLPDQGLKIREKISSLKELIEEKKRKGKSVAQRVEPLSPSVEVQLRKRKGKSVAQNLLPSVDYHKKSIDGRDLSSLDPGKELNSSSINYQLRYLQVNGIFSTKNCYFFSTFFYPKLEAIYELKATDEAKTESELARIRKWWTDIEILGKSYLIIPIHERDIQHWRLVIVCLPEKDDNSGLDITVFELDSLVREPGTKVFKAIKWFLQKEWEHLKTTTTTDLPLPSRLLKKNLERKERIKRAEIKVPKQENAYDCGAFVLCFVEMFLRSAPQRLTSDYFAMFKNGDWCEGDKYISPTRMRLEVQNRMAHSLRNTDTQSSFVKTSTKWYEYEKMDDFKSMKPGYPHFSSLKNQPHLIRESVALTMIDTFVKVRRSLLCLGTMDERDLSLSLLERYRICWILLGQWDLIWTSRLLLR